MSYFTSFLVILFAGFFCPYGLTSLPVTAGLFAVAGALSPFLLMMRWFRTKRFVKLAKEPLEIHRNWRWIVSSLVVVFIYVFVLGQTLHF
jgi:membrane protease YdiL (CAAX protease family)